MSAKRICLLVALMGVALLPACGSYKTKTPALPSALSEAVVLEGPIAKLRDANIEPLELQERLPVTLESSLRFALANNLEIAKAQASVREAVGNKNLKKAPFLPEVGVKFKTGKVEGDVQGSFGNIEEVDFDKASFFGSLGLTLNPGLSYYELLAATSRAEATVFQSQADVQRILFETSEAYLILAQTQSMAATLLKKLENQKRVLALAEIKSREGLTEEYKIRLEEEKTQKLEREYRNAKRDFYLASSRLGEYLRQPAWVTLYPSETEYQRMKLVAPMLRLKDLIKVAEARNPQLKMKEKLFQAAIESRKGSFWAVWDTVLRVAFLFGGVGENFSSLKHQNDLESGVSGAWNLFAGERITVAEAKKEIAEIAKDDALLKIHANLVRAYEHSRAAADSSILIEREFVAVGNRLLSLRVRFENGLEKEESLLEVENRLEEVRHQRLASILDYNRAQIELLNRLGQCELTSIVGN